MEKINKTSKDRTEYNKNPINFNDKLEPQNIDNFYNTETLSVLSNQYNRKASSNNFAEENLNQNRISSTNQSINKLNIDNHVEVFSERTKPSDNIMSAYKYNLDNFQTLQENNNTPFFSTISSNKGEFNYSKGNSFNKQSVDFNQNQNKFTIDYQAYNTTNKSTDNYNFKFDPSLYREQNFHTQQNVRNALISSGNDKRENSVEKTKKVANFNVNNLTMKNVRPNSKISNSTVQTIHTPSRSLYATQKTIHNPQVEAFSVSSTPQMSNRIGTNSISDNRVNVNTPKYSSILTKDRSSSPAVQMNPNYGAANSLNKRLMKIPNK
jgi:hypothetical protein